MNSRAAVSGYGNVGMSALLRIAWPAATSAPPIQLASTGLPSSEACFLSASAVWVASVMACGVRMTSIPSLFGSFAAISSACA